MANAVEKGDVSPVISASDAAPIFLAKYWKKGAGPERFDDAAKRLRVNAANPEA